MKTFTLVTGNEHKLKEWQRLLPAGFILESIAVELDEIQSADSVKIVEHKAKQAYTVAKKPVIVEDVTAGLKSLGGLPGPFIKFFEQQMGRDALYKLSSDENDIATITCTICYYDGKKFITAVGSLQGKVVPLRGTNGFGFDSVFVPEGHTKTFAEMDPKEKDKMSHRAQALKQLLTKLQDIL